MANHLNDDEKRQKEEGEGEGEEEEEEEEEEEDDDDDDDDDDGDEVGDVVRDRPTDNKFTVLDLVILVVEETCLKLNLRITETCR